MIVSARAKCCRSGRGSHALRLDTYIEDAERDGDVELADFFRRAQGESRKGAEQGKYLLKQRL
ncbi:hypothetical protein [Actinomadura sp.]|uniref:hypothetical protein n=1 Tax=Actinomadura sp. TaxID=1989 RepID=UPI0037CB0CC3